MKNNKETIIAFVEMATTFVLLIGCIVSYSVIYNSCSGYIGMIIGSADMTDQAIIDITEGIRTGMPIVIVVWSIYTGMAIWKYIVTRSDKRA